MIITETVRTADNTPGSAFVDYVGEYVSVQVCRSLLDRPPPETLVMHVSIESKRLVRGRVELG